MPLVGFYDTVACGGGSILLCPSARGPATSQYIRGRSIANLSVRKGVRQGCILSPHLFNLHMKKIVRKVDLDDIMKLQLVEESDF